MIAGLVLAGGRSGRFGSEKAVVRMGELTLLEWALAALGPDCAALAISASEGSQADALAKALFIHRLRDDPAHPAGPLAGVAAGLRWASSLGASQLATLPCDTPRAPRDMVAHLRDAGGEAFAAWATTADGDHPLCALWSIDLLAPLESELARGHPPVWAFLRDLGGVAVPFGDAAAFTNINAPGDLTP